MERGFRLRRRRHSPLAFAGVRRFWELGPGALGAKCCLHSEELRWGRCRREERANGKQRTSSPSQALWSLCLLPLNGGTQQGTNCRSEIVCRIAAPVSQKIVCKAVSRRLLGPAQELVLPFPNRRTLVKAAAQGAFPPRCPGREVWSVPGTCLPGFSRCDVKSFEVGM